MDLLKIFDIADSMNMLSGSFMEVISKYLMIAAIPVLIIALINCFLGHKVFKILVGLAGIFIGAFLGVGIVMGFSMLTTKQMPAVSLMVIAAIIGAVIIGFGSFRLYKGGAFCMGFITGMILGVVVMKLMNKDEYIIAGVIGGLLMGLLAIDLYRHIVILLTSINGGMVSAACLAIILKKDDPLFILKLGIVLSVLGIIVQYILLFLSRKNADDDEDEESIDEKKNKKRLAGKNDRKVHKKLSKKDKKEVKRSTKNGKKNKPEKKKYDYQAEFFLVGIFSNAAQNIKDFIVDKFGSIEEDEEEEEAAYEEREEFEEDEEDDRKYDIKENKKEEVRHYDIRRNDVTKSMADKVASPQVFDTKIISKKVEKSNIIVKEEDIVTHKTADVKNINELNQQLEEVNIPTFDLDDIGHKLEEELEHSLDTQKDKDLEDLIIKEAYRNLD